MLYTIFYVSQSSEAFETGQAEVCRALQPDRQLLARQRRHSEVHRVFQKSFGCVTKQRRSPSQSGNFICILLPVATGRADLLIEAIVFELK